MKKLKNTLKMSQLLPIVGVLALWIIIVFEVKESDKSIIVGENSGGYVGYGEVGEIITPCYKFDLTCTMTRYDKNKENLKLLE